MEFILKSISVVDGGDTSRSRSRGISALYDETWDQAVEDCVGVVAIETMLEKIAGCEGSLFGEELQGQIARSGPEDNLCCGLRFEVI